MAKMFSDHDAMLEARKKGKTEVHQDSKLVEYAVCSIDIVGPISGGVAINLYNGRLFGNYSGSITAASIADEFKNGPMSKNAFDKVVQSAATRGFSCS